jgi:O-antigen ligase
MKLVLEPIILKVIVATGVLTTLAINPWHGYDPINLPKMFILCVGSGFLITKLFIDLKNSSRGILLFTLLSFLFLSTLIISFLSNDAPWSQQVWGVWGRSTGLLTYGCFIVIMLSSAVASSESFLKLVRVVFERLGYFVTGYAFLQVMDLDPISWSQKAMVTTLGNINFTSSFLGLVSTSYLSRLLLQRIAISQFVFFTLTTLANVLLILYSKSIQGIAILLAGLAILIAFILRKHSFGKAITSLVISVFIGIIVFTGTMGFGPLSFMRQETVIYRLDYWKAGINMLFQNPLNGVGIDSYGDYYRTYRDIEAVTRTGPQRVTNTAHNIFLDVASGSGAIAGLLFLVLFLLTAISIYRGLKNNSRNIEFITFSAIWIGFVVFCLISINQIGVGVWGFIFTGTIVGFVNKYGKNDTLDEKKVKLRKEKVQIEKSNRLSASSLLSNGPSLKPLTLVTSIFCSFIFAIVSAIPNAVDARYLKAIQSQNSEIALSLFDNIGTQGFHNEQVISLLLAQGKYEKAFEMAQRLIDKNPQSWLAWVTIFQGEASSDRNRVLAAEKLIQLDPNNDFIKEDVRELLSRG